MTLASFDCKRERNELISWLLDHSHTEMEAEISSDLDFYLKEYSGDEGIILREHETMLTIEVWQLGTLITTKNYNFIDYSTI